MGIMTHLAWRTWRSDRGRTWLTILAMTIATTLAVATLVGLRSAQISVYRYDTQEAGGYVVAFPKVPANRVAALRAEPGLAKTTTYQTAGSVRVPQNSSDEQASMPWLKLTPAAMRQLVAPVLIKGRVPQHADEVAIPAFVAADAKHMLTVTQGKTKRRLKVVGWYRSYSNTLLDLGIITVTNQASGVQTVVASPSGFSNLQAELKAMAKRAHIAPKTIRTNDQALQYMGAGQDRRSQAAVAATVGVVLLIIGSVALVMIYTSINLTVQAHRQRYGLLRSLGTTPKQLRRLVYLESLQLAVPALGLGMFLGIGGLALTLHLINAWLHQSGLPLTMVLVADWLPLLIAAIFMALVTLLAAARPAWRASRLTPIAAIRLQTPSPKLSKRRLRSTWLMRHIHNPLAALALKNERRSGQRVTMTATLMFTILLFIGLTGFMRNFLGAPLPERSVDVVASVTGKQAAQVALQQTLQQAAEPKQVVTTRQAYLTATKGPQALRNQMLIVYTVADRVYASRYHNTPTLLNRRIEQGSANGKNVTHQWLVAPDYTGALTITRGDPGKVPHVTIAQTRVVPDTQLPDMKLLTSSYGGGALVVSETLMQNWLKVLKTPQEATSATIAATLKRPQDHTAVTKALIGRFPGIQVTDYVADEQQGRTILLIMRILTYGFIGLLSLVSLATIINHTFAQLMAQRRSLAMLQSIGTTPTQLTGMLAIQNARLFVAGGVLGSVAGVAVAYGLFRLMGWVKDRQFIWPWGELVAVWLALAVIWGIFAIFTRRMLRKQDIDQLIRMD